MHGGSNPGAPKGKANGAFTTGLWTKELAEARALLRAVRRATKDLYG
jgi:hypothetical protein